MRPFSGAIGRYKQETTQVDGEAGEADHPWIGDRGKLALSGADLTRTDRLLDLSSVSSDVASDDELDFRDSAGSVASGVVHALLHKKWATCRAQRIKNEAGAVFRFARGVILDGVFFALMECETDATCSLVYRAARAVEVGETRFQLSTAHERERVLTQSVSMASHGIVTEIDLDGNLYQAWAREPLKVAMLLGPAAEAAVSATAADELDDERRKVRQLVAIVEKLRDQLARQSSNGRHSSPLKASAGASSLRSGVPRARRRCRAAECCARCGRARAQAARG
jgi:hypothetical protein